MSEMGVRLVPGWEGTRGPTTNQYQQPHVYARDVNSSEGLCLCKKKLGNRLHVMAAPGVPVPVHMREDETE